MVDGGSGQVRLSVVMPAYNEAATVLQILKTVCAQVEAMETVRDYEIIFVDDKSTDETLALVQEFAQSNPNVTIIEQPQSAAKARPFNLVFSGARATWFWFKTPIWNTAPKITHACLTPL